MTQLPLERLPLTLNATVSASENKIRGQAIRSNFDVLDGLAGAGAKERVLSCLPRDIADAYRYGAIVASGWFPIGWFRELHAAIKQVAPSVPSIHRQIGEAATSQDIRGIYRFVLRITTPSFAFANAGRILGTYVKDHQSTVLECARQSGRIRLVVPGANAEVWSVIAGASEAVLKTCGARQPTVALRVEGSGSTAVIDATWKPDAMGSGL